MARRRWENIFCQEPRQRQNLAGLIGPVDAKTPRTVCADQFAHIEKTGNWRWVEGVDVVDAAVFVGISRLLRQPAAERVTSGDELSGRTATFALQVSDDAADMVLDCAY